ncbi:MAG: Polynucleotide adenylyltransferase/metal dependent phosphohydrolase [Candidatus Daviesbacteria bacterium GW2011_GWA2_38_24]|uniref:Polynucleotide adenylyltransferase/metal dependent phosphohydrolase n=1 Tax=Candidatus Daviesbacteria bacterium GW2011_GWA2_38_24 TaxID=1618422 RepID=A0A0G0JI44_9BACT|nr:MAG: Polynucleotide adenylyltransferase/metal dependent phosphohydrolase [Candidatus Daviesbacteria bacterium GW2011_GWA2_38_24]KKQ79926.1 MAG: Polynucleotide adenylyltransferase/metal dependent phosphohydrolase [Candidatus Daviesbacteria bacterium GW2011_GWA1_38_7]OGE23451.1 MAG: hypothetical protein A2688_01530 [Candidatus Daviesbacteria bacterium RIFCSPHIGHO2_01_FULL_38_8]
MEKLAINQLPKRVVEIFNEIKQTDFQVYLVGGAVRDLILGRELKDLDFTTDAKPEEILKIFPNGHYNNKFGTVSVPSDSGVIEITTMRREEDYTDFRHPAKIVWTNKIEEDLKRRDFTINAIALEVGSNENIILIDPFHGQTDLENKLIRAVENPDIRFHEDALRLIRAIRFATELHFSIEENTFESVKNDAPKITNISWERIRDELFNILASDDPADGMILLKNSGLLKFILPELDKTFGIVQEGPKHVRIYDIGEHSFNSLKFCSSSDPIVRFATLIHDVGKVDTFKVQEDGNVTFYGHDVVGGKIALKICQRLRLSKKDTDRVVKLVRFHLFTVDEKQTDSAIRRFIKNVGLENLDDMFALREADRLGGGTEKPTSWRLEKFKERIKEVLHKPFSITDLKVNGEDVMETLNIPPGRKVGEVLESLLQEVQEDQSKNNREYLLERIKQLY